MIVYSHRFAGVLQQLVIELGLDLVLSDGSSPVNLADNELMINDVANSLGIEVKKLAAADGSILFKFQRRPT
ncbi:MAG: hypothetical protein AAF646_15050 [Pseudomonadota bacterium]